MPHRKWGPNGLARSAGGKRPALPSAVESEQTSPDLAPTPRTRLACRRTHALLLLALLVALGAAGLGLRAYLQAGANDERDARPRTDQRRATPPTASPRSVFPTARQVDAARRLAEGRLGDISFAVVDTAGKLHCHRCRESYAAASVVKAMLLVAYLDGLARESSALSPAHRAQLDAMIRVSDNASATDIHAHVGNGGLRLLAQRAGMRDFVVIDAWPTARITAADQARLFASIRALLPAAHREYASQLLASVVPAQSWGIPEVSRPGWITLFKGGWRKTKRGELVHQVARLEDGNAVIALAILTDANPRAAYGRATIRGIAQRLLAPTLTPG